MLAVFRGLRNSVALRACETISVDVGFVPPLEVDTCARCARRDRGCHQRHAFRFKRSILAGTRCRFLSFAFGDTVLSALLLQMATSSIVAAPLLAFALGDSRHLCVSSQFRPGPSTMMVLCGDDGCCIRKCGCRRRRRQQALAHLVSRPVTLGCRCCSFIASFGYPCRRHNTCDAVMTGVWVGNEGS